MKSLLSDIDTTENNLEINFSLTKQELEKELDQRKKIVRLQKEHILKRLINRTTNEVNGSVKLVNESDRRLKNIARVQIKRRNVNPPAPQVVPNPPSNQSAIKDQQTTLLMNTVTQQQQSISAILNALKGLNSFKSSVQSQLGSMSDSLKKRYGNHFEKI